MMSVVSADKLPQDVAGAESLLIKHKQRDRMKIDSLSERFQNLERCGHEMLEKNHDRGKIIRKNLDELAEAIQNLERAWIERHTKLDQCLKLQLFISDCKKAEDWMVAKELWVKDSIDGSQGNMEALEKIQESFDLAIDSQKEKIDDLKSSAEGLIQSNHYDIPIVAGRRDEVLKKWRKLKSVLVRSLINLVGQLQQQQSNECGCLCCGKNQRPSKTNTKSQILAWFNRQRFYKSTTFAATTDEASSGFGRKRGFGRNHRISPKIS